MEGKTEVKRIKAACPNCYADPEKVIYQNSGPLVRIYCPECGFVCHETDAWKNHFSDVIDYWNHIGFYMVQDG